MARVIMTWSMEEESMRSTHKFLRPFFRKPDKYIYYAIVLAFIFYCQWTDFVIHSLGTLKPNGSESGGGGSSGSENWCTYVLIRTHIPFRKLCSGKNVIAWLSAIFLFFAANTIFFAYCCYNQLWIPNFYTYWHIIIYTIIECLSIYFMIYFDFIFNHMTTIIIPSSWNFIT